MRIAVLSDTHDRLPPDLPGRLAGADEIWHLGDVCNPTTLLGLEALGLPLKVILGNCDSSSDWPLILKLRRGGTAFHLEHIPPRVAPRGCDVVLHGHTHVPRDEVDERGVRWLNPGCITRPNRGAPASFGWLTFDKSGFTWKLERL